MTKEWGLYAQIKFIRKFKAIKRPLFLRYFKINTNYSTGLIYLRVVNCTSLPYKTTHRLGMKGFTMWPGFTTKYSFMFDSSPNLSLYIQPPRLYFYKICEYTLTHVHTNKHMYTNTTHTYIQTHAHISHRLSLQGIYIQFFISFASKLSGSLPISS